jgi:hypothetical protein
MRGVCLLSVIMPVRPIAGNTLPISPNPTRRRYDGGRGRIVRIVKKPIIRQFDLEFIQPQVPIQSDLSPTPPHPTPSPDKSSRSSDVHANFRSQYHWQTPCASTLAQADTNRHVKFHKKINRSFRATYMRPRPRARIKH